MIRAVLVAAAALAGVAPVSAQEGPTAQQPRCWLANDGYSPGTTIRSGETVMECQADFTWQTTTKSAAGCLSEGQFFGPGATVLAGWQDSHVKQKCQLDGSWTTED